MTFEAIPAQWQDRFESLVGNIQEYGLIVSPYITAPPVERMVHILEKRGVASLVRLDVLTDLSTHHILYGSTDPVAIISLMDAVPHTRVTYLPRLHAKVYIADESEAIVTSANLTEHGLLWNYEYGIRITDPACVRQIREDILAYGELGNTVSRTEMERLARTASDLKEMRERVEREAGQKLMEAFRRRINEAETELMEIRAGGKTTNGIFADTIVYLLRKYGPMRTVELHPRIQQIHPDLCDDSIDRVIKGVHFGKKWKHYVRNAQQTLKRQGIIDFDGQRWYLVQDDLADQ
ncbi:MAG: phospholipase D-like domain-containing protein [Anaerolineae bacterium]|nr:phospholipase D-like domain-containing protein [Anaerolineae bacterium]